MTEAPGNLDDLISDFVGLTGVSPQIAQDYLANSSYDFQSAVTEFYNPVEETDPAPPPPASSSSAPQPIPTSTPMPQAPTEHPRKKFATLGDLAPAAVHQGHAHDDDDDSEDEDYKPDLYAGGEKSGLAVENPDDLRRKIIERTKKNLSRPGGDDPRAPASSFQGTARTLGGDDVESQVIDDPTASQPQRPGPVERRLHFWADGFSVDDGPLYAANDPKNSALLAQIKNGRAPLDILKVEPDQEVDVKLERHKENYVQPKKKYQPFQGGGQRLGSPTPGVESRAKAPSAEAAAPAVVPALGTSQPSIDVNEDEPTISLQIRLGDGTRLVSRFNTAHTIGDVYNFVNASSPSSRGRAWALMTTFPSKELQDKSQVLGDLAEFKRGGVVVQKWQ